MGAVGTDNAFRPVLLNLDPTILCSIRELVNVQRHKMKQNNEKFNKINGGATVIQILENVRVTLARHFTTDLYSLSLNLVCSSILTNRLVEQYANDASLFALVTALVEQYANDAFYLHLLPLSFNNICKRR